MRRRTASTAVGILTCAILTLTSSSCASREPLTITVFAAASFTEVMEGVAAAYEADHPGIDIVTSYGGSADLVAQINEGAPADVFISADESRMDAVSHQVAGEVLRIASNHLTIAVPAGNPADVVGLGDLARDDVTTVVCAPHVPCGAAAQRLANALGITLRASSEEQSVSDVLGKVASGQADAGLVYVTDIARASGVQEVPVAGAGAVTNHYVAAAMAGSAHPEVAADFVIYLASDEAQSFLAAAGFGAAQEETE